MELLGRPVAESFFATLKKQAIHGFKLQTKDQMHVGVASEPPELHPARGPPRTELWAGNDDNHTAVHDPADKDQSLHW